MPQKFKPAKLRFGFGGSLGTWPQVETSDDVLVARTYGPDEDDYARLFAAAPDLLAACDRLLASVDAAAAAAGPIAAAVSAAQEAVAKARCEVHS